MNDNGRNWRVHLAGILGVTALVVLLYFMSRFSYLLFHSLIEFFSIAIAFTAFMVTWNARKYIRNSYLLLVGYAYLYIAVLDLFHTLSYKGMNIFTDYDYYANQLWIGARFFESVVLAGALLLAGRERSFSAWLPNVVYGAITLLILLSIFVWRVFPICFIEGVGLTPFKKTAEYVISGILAVAILSLFRRRTVLSPDCFNLLLASLILTILSELCFTAYKNNYAFINLVGHYLKAGSFYTVYRILIVKGIREPYDHIFREMTENQKTLRYQNEQLTEVSIRDGLTGLFNYRCIRERLMDAQRRHARYGEPFSILILDLDRFKLVNDTQGHIVGDAVLKEFSGLLTDSLRNLDIAGRYGGEEFLVILPGTGKEGARAAAEKIRLNAEAHTFVNEVRMTVSIGVASYHEGGPDEFISQADANLYMAKHAGRNRVAG